jgi:hypothetical protein
MKKLLLLTTLTASLIASAASKAGTVTLMWTNTNAQTYNVNIFFTTNPALPTSQWPLLVGNVPSPANAPASFSTNLPPANYFFVAAFTNSFWGTNTFFSNGTATPSLPTNLLTSFGITNQ